MAIPAIKDTVFHVQTRREAIEVIAAGATNAIHDHSANPLIYNAASELIMRDDRGQKTDINAVGLPHQVLAQVSDELHQLGVSYFASSQIMEALEGYTIGLGADFAREAQAKPLYARVMVTDKKPDDIPECELVQTTLIDGERRVGDGVGQRVMQSTIYGTRTSMTRELNLDEMFASSRKKWLMIYYGSPSGETFKGLDDVDVSLINVAQGLGGYVSQEVIDDIQTAVQNGEASPTLLDMVDDFAKVRTVLEEFKGQIILPVDVQAVVQKLVTKIDNGFHFLTQEQRVMENIVPALGNALTNINSSYETPLAELNFVKPPQLSRPDIAANDGVYASNITGDIIMGVENMDVVDVIPSDLAARISEIEMDIQKDLSRPKREAVITVAELIQILIENKQNINPDNKDISAQEANLLKQLDIIEKGIQGQTPEKVLAIISDSLKGNVTTAHTELGLNIQSIVLSLAQPSVLSHLQSFSLPQMVQAQLKDFPIQNAKTIEAVATLSLVREIEAKLSGVTALKATDSPLLNLEPADLKQALQILKTDGLAGLIKPEVRAQMSESTKPIFEQFIQTLSLPQMVQAQIKDLPIQNVKTIEAIATLNLVHEIEAKLSGVTALKATDSPLLNLEPADLKQALQILKTDGLAGLIKPEVRAQMSESAKHIFEQFIQNDASMVAAATTAAIIRDVERAVMVSNNRSSDGATQMIVSVAQILSEPSRGISATEYTKNIEILAKITNHIVSSPSTDPIQSFPKMIDTWVKTPEGLADINSFIAAIERRPLESIPPQVKEFLQEAKVSILVASAETHIEQYQYKMNDNSIGYVTHSVAVDNAIEGLKEAVESRNPELIHQALDSVTTALQEAGRKDFSDNEEDKRVEAIPATAPPDSVVEFKKTDEELPTTPSFEPKEVITDVRPDVPVVPPHDFVPPSTPSIKPLPTHIPPTPSPIPIRLSEALPETKIPSFSPRVDFKPVEPRKRNGFLDRIVNGIKSCPMGSAVCCCTTEARKVFSKPVEKVSKSFNHAAGCGCSDCATQKLGNANDLDAFLNASPT